MVGNPYRHEREKTMSERLLDARQVAAKVGLSVSMIYTRMKENNFPRAKRVGKQARRWKESEIDAWINELPDADTDEWHCPRGPARKADKQAA